MKRVLLAACAAVCVASGAWASDDNREPMTFPYGGVTTMARLVGKSIGAGSFATLDSVAVGNSGVVRSILLHDVGMDSTTVQQYWMTVRYDGRMTGAADDSFPLAGVMGYVNEAHQAADTLSVYDTPGWARPLPWCRLAGNRATTFHFKFPMPYTNGIVLRLYAVTTDKQVWATTTRQTQLPACWNRTWRFHVAYMDSTADSVRVVPNLAGGTRSLAISTAGAITGTRTRFSSAHVGWALLSTAGQWDKEVILRTVTDTTHATIAPSDTAMILDPGTSYGLDEVKMTRPLVLFRRAATKTGVIVAMTGSMVAFANGTGLFADFSHTQLEACLRVYNSATAGASGEAPLLTASGLEDVFGGTNYRFPGYQGVPGTGNSLTGATVFNNDDTNGWTKLTAYRYFDPPIVYTTGCTATLTNYLDKPNTRFRWCVQFYERAGN